MRLLKNKVNVRVGILANGLAFFFSAIASFENDGIITGIVTMSGAVINLFAFFLSKKYPIKTNILLFLLNSIFCGFMSYSTWYHGSDKIQYGWGVASLMNLIGAWRFWLKSRKREIET